MAAYGFKGIGWFLCGMIFAPASYLVTSWGAAEHAQLESVERAIVTAKKDIRGLETEFDTRANMAQIERWNGDVLSLAAPTPAQYLHGEQGLAALQSPQGAEQQQAAMVVVPSGAPEVTAQPQLAAADAHGAPALEHAVARMKSSDLPSAGHGNATSHRVGGEAMAMLDDRLLSPATMNELKASAKFEKLALR